MSQDIETIVKMMQDDLKNLHQTADELLALTEFDPLVDDFIRGYYANGQDSFLRIMNYVDENPDMFEKTGDEFRDNVRIMREIVEKINLLEKKFQ
jgi:hypothetical protein